jgi:hypothetical protein
MIDLLRWRRKSRIGEGSDRHRDQIRHPARLPKNSRTAFRAKVKYHSVAAVGRSSENPILATKFQICASKESGYAVGASGSLLTRKAVA